MYHQLPENIAIQMLNILKNSNSEEASAELLNYFSIMPMEDKYINIILLILPNINSSLKCTDAMIRASKNDQIEIVKLLLQDGRAVPCSDCIKGASTNGHVEIVKLLLQDGRAVPCGDCIRDASKNGHVEIVKLLLQDGRAVPCGNCIKDASTNGHVEIVKLLLQDGRANPAFIDKSEALYTPIEIASQNGYTDIVELLLKDSRSNPNVCNCLSLYEASKCGYIKIVELLLQDPRVNPNVGQNRAICVAACNGHIEIVKLLAKKIDVSTITNQQVLDIIKPKSESEPIAQKILHLMIEKNIQKILINTESIGITSTLDTGNSSDAKNDTLEIMEYMKKINAYQVKISEAKNKINIKYIYND